MTTQFSPLARTVREATVKRWKDTETGRREQHVDWQATRTVDGTLMVSARIDGPNPGRALHQFADRQAQYLANRSLTSGDRLPSLDVSVPGRTACVWRTDGVWVEIWHPDPATTPAVPGGAYGPPRGLLGGRLPFTRRRKETAA